MFLLYTKILYIYIYSKPNTLDIRYKVLHMQLKMYVTYDNLPVETL